MTKTIVDVDDELLAAAGEVLGTPTKKATINTALREIVEQQQRRDAVTQLLQLEFLGDLTHPTAERRTWTTEA